MAHQSWGSSKKSGVRERVILEFRKRTGLKAIPDNRTCLALCGRQENKPGFQIHQYIDAGFIQPGQYVGVDRDEAIVEFNRSEHPEEEFVAGEWGQRFATIMSQERKPMLIDLDTTSCALTGEAIEWAASAFCLAEPGTFVAFNVSMKNIYRPGSPKAVIDQVMARIGTHVPPRVLKQWVGVGSFPAQTKRTPMRTFLFYLPEVQLAA